ncbi:hypothetical protein B0H10DRAFT_1283879 [Mycena sp. CBHHK59/15]|nr:hypothetical protein B0H10DRAFT_1283879 [Mycena sp. CBHHK59/15]
MTRTFRASLPSRPPLTILGPLTSQKDVEKTEKTDLVFEAGWRIAPYRQTRTIDIALPYFNLNQNQVLGQEFSDVIMKRYGMSTTLKDGSASTDFGNVSYDNDLRLMRSEAIPTEPNGGNHTIGFTRAAASEEAHAATMLVTRGLAHTGFRALRDDDFFEQVKKSFKS